MKKRILSISGGILISVMVLFIFVKDDFLSMIKGEESLKDSGIEVGEKAPDFLLKGLDGNTHSLKTPDGKPLAINFWASWCEPCKEEMPELVRLNKKYGNNVQLYGINLTSRDRMKDVKAFIKEFNVNYPILLDKSGQVEKDYKVLAVPTTYFISSEGVIVDKIIGSNIEKIQESYRDLASDHNLEN
jgi:thiol-disulfide isomerase/thioredoxin